MLLYCFASLRFSFFVFILSLVCYPHYTRRNIKTLKSQTFKNPLLISIFRRQTKII